MPNMEHTPQRNAEGNQSGNQAPHTTGRDGHQPGGGARGGGWTDGDQSGGGARGRGDSGRRRGELPKRTATFDNLSQAGNLNFQDRDDDDETTDDEGEEDGQARARRRRRANDRRKRDKAEVMEQVSRLAEAMGKFGRTAEDNEKKRDIEEKRRERQESQRQKARNLERQEYHEKINRQNQLFMQSQTSEKKRAPQAANWDSLSGRDADHLDRPTQFKEDEHSRERRELMGKMRRASPRESIAPSLQDKEEDQDWREGDQGTMTEKRENQTTRAYKMLLLTKTKKLTREQLYSWDTWSLSILNQIKAAGVEDKHWWCRFNTHLWIYGLLDEDLMNLAEADHKPGENIEFTSKEYLDKLKELLITEENPRQARFNFSSCKQGASESVESYHSALVKLFRKGNFKDQEFFVSGFLDGLSNNTIRDHLLKEPQAELKTPSDCLKKATYWRQVIISQLQYQDWGKKDYEGLKTSDIKQNHSTETYLMAKRSELAKPTMGSTSRVTYKAPRPPAPLPDMGGHLSIIETCANQPLFGEADGDEQIRIEEISAIQEYWEADPQEEEIAPEEEELCDLEEGARGGQPARVCWGCGKPGHLRMQCPLRRQDRLGRAAASDHQTWRGKGFNRNGRGGGRGGGARGGSGRGAPYQAKSF